MASLGSRSSWASTANFVTTGPGQRAIAEGGFLVFTLAWSRNGIGSTEAGRQALRDLNEKSITGSMAETVIEYLEPVDVDEQDCKLEVGMAPRNGERSPEAVEKEGSIGKVGQAVVKRVVRQHFLGSLALGNVTVHDDKLFHFAVGSADNTGSGFENTPRTVFMSDPIFEPLPAACKPGLFRSLKHSSPVVGMDLLRGRCCDQFVLALAKDFLVGWLL